MFRGFSNLALDVKGRLSVPARYREPLAAACNNKLVVTANPWDRCLWLYPVPEWEAAEAKLVKLSDADRLERRTKQILSGYATDCELDGHGRILLPPELRELAGLDRDVVLMGQRNRFDIWSKVAWDARCEKWFEEVDQPGGDLSGKLRELSL